ncbi:hypothetical protein RI054_06g34760 [Pseudoscourfieldia marina]
MSHQQSGPSESDPSAQPATATATTGSGSRTSTSAGASTSAHDDIALTHTLSELALSPMDRDDDADFQALLLSALELVPTHAPHKSLPLPAILSLAATCKGLQATILGDGTFWKGRCEKIPWYALINHHYNNLSKKLDPFEWYRTWGWAVHVPHDDNNLKVSDDVCSILSGRIITRDEQGRARFTTAVATPTPPQSHFETWLKVDSQTASQSPGIILGCQESGRVKSTSAPARAHAVLAIDTCGCLFTGGFPFSYATTLQMEERPFVADGKWHQVILTYDFYGTQTLMLDGRWIGCQSNHGGLIQQSEGRPFFRTLFGYQVGDGYLQDDDAGVLTRRTFQGELFGASLSVKPQPEGPTSQWNLTRDAVPQSLRKWL